MIAEDKRMIQCKLLLDALVGKDNSAKWWTSPNRAFNGLTPSAQWLINSDEVYNYLLSYSFGGEYS